MGRRLQKDAWIVNYYQFHIGDYLSATRHLSWDEDAAYRRMLDTYYTTEKPLPLDIKAVWRLVVAVSDSQREAVKSVLDEFFTRTDEGWVNRRADTEIAAMREKVDAVDEKDEHEKTRKERYRERRAIMFAALRERGIVPAWDVSMKDLQALMASHGTPGTVTGTPGTDHERDTCVTKDATSTAIPTPTPTPTPTEEKEKHTRFAPLVFLKAHGVDEKLAGDWLTLRRAKKLPATETAIQGIESEAAKAGMDLSKAITECCHRGWGGFKASWLDQKPGSEEARRDWI